MQNASEFALAHKDSLERASAGASQIIETLEKANTAALRIGSSGIVTDWIIRIGTSAGFLVVGTYQIETTLLRNLVLVVLGMYMSVFNL